MLVGAIKGKIIHGLGTNWLALGNKLIFLKICF